MTNPFKKIADQIGSDLSSGLMQDLQQDERGFDQLATLLKDLSGISLPKNSKNLCLMAGRLSPILRGLGFNTYAQYLDYLKSRQPALVQEFIEALTTNTTEFFREAAHFDVMKNVLPEIIQDKRANYNTELRVWCAAASSGQEPYSILMNIYENVPELMGMGMDVKFLATDIDREVLQKAARGVYTAAEIKGVPGIYRQKYFMPYVKGREKEPQQFVVRSEYREKIRFATFNLMTEPYPFQHPFDIVFCRNVLIYFEKATAARVIEKLAKSLRPGGYLFLGHSETGLFKAPYLKTVSHAVYQRK